MQEFWYQIQFGLNCYYWAEDGIILMIFSLQIFKPTQFNISQSKKLCQTNILNISVFDCILSVVKFQHLSALNRENSANRTISCRSTLRHDSLHISNSRSLCHTRTIWYFIHISNNEVRKTFDNLGSHLKVMNYQAWLEQSMT